MCENAEQDLVGKPLFEFVMYKPRHRACAVTRIETVRRKPLACTLIEFHNDSLLGELTVQLIYELVDDLLNNLDIQGLERHPRIESVAKFRRTGPFNIGRA